MVSAQAKRNMLDEVDPAFASINVHFVTFLAPFSSYLFLHYARPPETR